jgi:hypothetical protein
LAAEMEQRRVACRLSPVLLFEPEFAKPLLELHQAAGHGYPLTKPPIFAICALLWPAEEAA